MLAQQCFNGTYFNHMTNFNQKSEFQKWSTSGDLRDNKLFLGNIHRQVGVEIEYIVFGLVWYLGLVMLLSNYPGIDGCNNANQL